MKKQNYESFAASLDADAGLGLNVKTGEALACGAVGVHPLAKFVDFDGKPKPPRWVIPGFIGHGVTVIAGAPGVGKTTAILPLAMTAAGLHGDEALRPNQWRHVVYVTEDVEQVQRILAGIINFSDLGIDIELARERLHIVEAVRLDPNYVAEVGASYRDQFTRIVGGIEVLSLVVLDTKSAVLAIESENDNSEASAMLAVLKQGFDGLPVWLVGHVAKPNLNRSDVAALTTRGASAIDGDANQTIFLVLEKGHRFFLLGKVRFAPRWFELEIVSHTSQTFTKDEFGREETVVMIWGIATPSNKSLKEAVKEAKENALKEDASELRQAVREAVQIAWQTGQPLNRSGVRAKLNRNAQTVSTIIENLLSERWLYEVDVPAKIRAVNSKKAFLINLTTIEHDIVKSSGALPAAKLVIPVSWQKPVVSLVPARDSKPIEFDHE
jgi:hypothetical protein